MQRSRGVNPRFPDVPPQYNAQSSGRSHSCPSRGEVQHLVSRDWKVVDWQAMATYTHGIWEKTRRTGMKSH